MIPTVALIGKKTMSTAGITIALTKKAKMVGVTRSRNRTLPLWVDASVQMLNDSHHSCRLGMQTR